MGGCGLLLFGWWFYWFRGVLVRFFFGSIRVDGSVLLRVGGFG